MTCLKSNKTVFTLLLLTFLFSFSACSKDEDENPNAVTNQLMQGDWDVTSLTIDGVEQIGSLINSFDMEYTESFDNDISGEAEWLLIDVLGSSTKFEGDYQVKNQGNTVAFEGSDLDVSFVGAKLELTGNVNGNRWEIEAER